jgi:hypothetical protein
MYLAVHGVKATREWIGKLAAQRKHREASQAKKERRLEREARWAARTAAKTPPPSQSDPEASDIDDSDHDSFDEVASAAGSE